MKLGKHEVLIEGDLAICHSHGTLDPAEAEAFHEVVKSVFDAHGRIYLLLIVHEVGSPPSPETRRRLAQWSRERRVSAAAVVSTSLAVRASVSMIVGAIGVLRRERLPVAFFAREAAARAWLSEQRSVG